MAVLLSAVRILLPEISQYRAEIIATISESIGKPIEIESMTAGLNGIRPEVVLKQVKIIDPDRNQVVLRLDQLRAGLNLEEFLLTGNFQPRWFTIRGARLSVRREIDGSIKVSGLDSGAEMPKWIFEDGRFELLDSELVWHDARHPGAALHFSSADVRLLNQTERHRVAIDVDLPPKYGQSLSIRMDYSGDLMRKECCTGKIYAKANSIDFGRLLEGQSVEGFSIGQGRGGFTIWSSWEESGLTRLSGELDIQQAELSRRLKKEGKSAAAVSVPLLSGVFTWMRQSHGWNLSTRDLALSLGGQSWPRTNFALQRRFEPASGHSSIYVQSSYLEIDSISALLAKLGLLDAEQKARFAALKPSGEILDLSLGFSSASEKAPEWFLCAQLDGISIKPDQSLPGVTNGSAHICGDQSRGRIRLASVMTELEFPKLFRNPLDLASIQGLISWRRGDRAWKFRSDGIYLSNALLTAHGKLLLELPIQEGEAFLDLEAGFDQVDAKAVSRYLPVGVLRKPLIDWLDNAFVSGSVPHGGLLLRGPIQRFPFRDGSGVFETLFHTKDVVLSYHRDWPVIHSDDVEVRFFQTGMTVNGSDAEIMGSRIKEFQAHCDDFRFKDYLNVSGIAEGTLDQSIRFLMKSPLAPLYKPLLEFVSIHGENRIALDLNVPIRRRLSQILVQGDAELKNARLDAFGAAIEKISGNLRFSRENLSAKSIRGTLLDAPIQADLADNEQGLAVHINGAVGVDSLRERVPSTLWQYAEGASHYLIDLQIPKLSENLYADIAIRSDLKGMTLTFPGPIKKNATAAREFGLTMHLEPGQDIDANLNYGNIATARVKLAKNSEALQLKQGLIELGETSAAKLPEHGLSLIARLHELDLAAWKNALSGLAEKQKITTGPLSSVDLEVEKLRIENAGIGPFRLRMEQKSGLWEGTTQSPIARGKFNSIQREGRLRGLNLVLEYLKIPAQSELFDQVSQSPLHLDPSSILDLNVRVQHFQWKQTDYGSLELETVSQFHGLKINRLRLLGHGMNLNLSGAWTAVEAQHQTVIAGDLEIENLGLFLSDLGKANVIRDSTVNSKIALNWKAPFFNPDFKSLSGTARVEFGQGRLLTVEPGLGRVFGVFNLDGLKSLLLLDFGKLFGKGLAYDEVTSSFLLSRGRARIEQLMINAVPAEIKVSGEIDLAAEQLDDIVTVVPKGVVAAGATMLLTQRLPGKTLDGLINRQYRVTGKWDDPKIVRLPGSGKPLESSPSGAWSNSNGG